jgi:hypothetical protein
MQFYYGAQNILRALDEAEFWKHQEAEHADLIPIVTPNLEEPYVKMLAQFGREMRKLNEETVKYVESIVRSEGAVSPELKAQMLELITLCVEQSKKFVDFLEELLISSRAVRANPSSVAVIHHIIRESQYFIGIAQLILQ